MKCKKWLLFFLVALGSHPSKSPAIRPIHLRPLGDVLRWLEGLPDPAGLYLNRPFDFSPRRAMQVRDHKLPTLPSSSLSAYILLTLLCFSVSSSTLSYSLLSSCSPFPPLLFPRILLTSSRSSCFSKSSSTPACPPCSPFPSTLSSSFFWEGIL